MGEFNAIVRSHVKDWNCCVFSIELLENVLPNSYINSKVVLYSYLPDPHIEKEMLRFVFKKKFYRLVSILNRKCVAPYVTLDIIDFIFSHLAKDTFERESSIKHWGKISNIICLKH